jgi:hypothetical protein
VSSDPAGEILPWPIILNRGFLSSLSCQVGSGDNMAGKEQLVLKGLDASRQSIDDFLSFFSADTVDAVRKRVLEENQMNIKEFDSKTLGPLLNVQPQGSTV